MKALLLPILICILFLPDLSATHIIGGSISYSYLSNNLYEIRLEVLRDCFHGDPGAQYDDPASIGVFRPDGQYVDQILMPYNDLSTYFLSDDGYCEFTTFVCVTNTIYIDTISLANEPDGYILAYQRCCRSSILQNLVDPLQSGMTFHTHVQPLLENSSPVFTQEFPLGIFANTPFVYDGSAIDPDGDSLVYVLAHPYFGADMIFNKPQPPNPPPYEIGAFRPPYSVNNMLGGDYPLTIHPSNGEISAIPNTIGAFQIAYAVQEYRNGELIGTTSREFAFIVQPQGEGQTYNINGEVRVDFTERLDLGVVQILERDILTDSLHIYAEQPVGPNGSYSFTGIPAGVFYVKAIPDPASIYYNDYLPTYFPDYIFWDQAVPMNQCDTTQDYRNIDLYSVYNAPPGIFELEGFVKLAGRNDVPAAGLSLILFEGIFDLPRQSRITDENGYFKFTQLSAGPYWITADVLNASVHHALPPRFNLSGSTTIQLYLYEDSLSFQMPTAINPITESIPEWIHLNPNPGSDVINIDLDDHPGFYTYQIFNAAGQQILEGIGQGLKPSTISISNLPSGIYYLKVEGQHASGVQKFIKE